MKKGMNIGAGPVHLNSDYNVEWENSDFAQTESAAGWTLEKLRDFTKPFDDVPADSIDYIIFWHCVEHLGLHEKDAVLFELKRMLKPGGRLYIACPDLTKIAKNIVARQGAWQDWFICMVNVFGPYNGYVGDYHKWGYDEESLKKLLGDQIGFSQVFNLFPDGLAREIGMNNAVKVGFADYNVQLEAVK